MSTEFEADGGGQGQIILYATPEGGARIECRFVEESLWLTQLAKTLPKRKKPARKGESD